MDGQNASYGASEETYLRPNSQLITTVFGVRAILSIRSRLMASILLYTSLGVTVNKANTLRKKLMHRGKVYICECQSGHR
jgi:hypothetical protein